MCKKYMEWQIALVTAMYALNWIYTSINMHCYCGYGGFKCYQAYLLQLGWENRMQNNLSGRFRRTDQATDQYMPTGWSKLQNDGTWEDLTSF